MEKSLAPRARRAGDGLVRVVVTGAESTGKTTLARALARHYGTAWAPEYVRHFVDAKGAPPVAEEVDAIAQGHLEAEAALQKKADGLLILDTDLVSTCLYSRHLYGACPAWIDAAADAHAADLYLLAADDIPWAPDAGQRESPASRSFFQPLFRAELERRGLPYLELRGSLEERLRAATAAIDRLLTERAL